jgi:hypothetical protein
MSVFTSIKEKLLGKDNNMHTCKDGQFIHDIILQEERGQSLVIVLLMIIIAVIIAVAISFRTIQDVRRAGEEKASDKAANQVISVLDVVSETAIMNDVMEECEGAWDAGEECVLTQTDIKTDYLSDTDTIDETCEELEVALKPEDGINDFFIRQDDVLELDLMQVDSAGHVDISWENANDDQPASHLNVKTFYTETDCSWNDNNEPEEQYGGMDCTDNAKGLTRTGGWGSAEMMVADGSVGQVNYSETAVVMRIRPMGGDINITITNLPEDKPYIVAGKGHCYTTGSNGEDIYREFVRRVWVNPYVPACFDYILFSGDDGVVKGGG